MHGHRISVAPTDAALVSLTRRGDDDAFRALVARHAEAVRLAVSLLGGSPTLVHATFDVAHGCLQRESASPEAVRPFVLQLAHHLHLTPAPEGDLVRGDSCVCTPFRDAVSEHRAVATEVSGLPPSWQAALWHRLVEREDNAAVGAVIGVSPLKVPWLVSGALDTVRRNLVARHRAASPTLCLGYALRLERWAAAGTGGGVPRAVLRHATGCTRCSGLLDDLGVVTGDLPRVLATSLLGTAGEGYLAARISTGSPRRG